MAKTAADLKKAQETAAAQAKASAPSVPNAKSNVKYDYRGTILDSITGDPRDLPQTGSSFQQPYHVGLDTGTAGDGGFPPGGGGGGGGGYRTSSSSGGSNAYKAAVLPSATSQADYINTMYDALEAKRKAAFEAEYDARVGALDRQAATIAPQYQQAVNAAAAQSAVSQAAFNERAAAAGINTGAGSQAALAQNNALVSGVSAIRQAESEALADIEKQRVELKTQYQKAIAEAIANNEAERAQALYQEAMRVDESIVNTAINQATENFRAWQARYG